MNKMKMIKQADEAALVYMLRLSRSQQPHCYQNSTGAWILSMEDRLSCCEGIQEKFLVKHSRGIEHVARMYEISPNTLRTAVRKLRNARNKIRTNVM